MPEQLKTTAPQRNALLWSWLVLGWVQRNSNFGSLDRRLKRGRQIYLGFSQTVWGGGVRVACDQAFEIETVEKLLTSAFRLWYFPSSPMYEPLQTTTVRPRTHKTKGCHRVVIELSMSCHLLTTLRLSGLCLWLRPIVLLPERRDRQLVKTTARCAA